MNFLISPAVTTTGSFLRSVAAFPNVFLRRASNLASIAVFGLSLALSGCVQMTLDDLGEPSAEISAKLLSEMHKKGMSPESPVLVRIFKMESELEVWKVDSSGKYALLKTFPMCRWSGKLGPKTKEGDRQAPEGFYNVTAGMLNPKSQFYLSFNLGYPNKLESALGYTGEALMVHGACSSSGCYALTDQGVGEIYAIVQRALNAGQPGVQVQAFPFRMTPENLVAHRDDPNMPFWRNIREGYDIFEATHAPPTVGACSRRYVFNAEFEGRGPLNSLVECPKRLDAADPTVLAKQALDERKIADLTQDSTAPKVLAYQDGGMHPIFRALLKQNGSEKLAAKVSEINYPVSRPEAALSDPYE